MKNSQLALRVFIGLILLTGLITTIIFVPIFLLVIGIFVTIIYIVLCIVETTENYENFDKKWNIFYHMSKFLNSFPQIIKDKKDEN